MTVVCCSAGSVLGGLVFCEGREVDYLAVVVFRMWV